MNKNEFVRENGQSLKDLVDKFNELEKEYLDCLKLKNSYERHLYIEETNETGLTFLEQLTLNDMVDYYIKNDMGSIYVDDAILNTLKEKVNSLICNDAAEYNKILKRFKKLNSDLDFLFHSVTFFRLEEKKFSIRCGDNHLFVRFPDELRCACCGATTKDYELTNKELDFLEKCADNQEQLIKRATKDEFPLLEAILIPRLDYEFNKLYDSLYEKYGEINYARLTYDEDFAIKRKNDRSSLRIWIKLAHDFDEGTYHNVFSFCPKYLSDEVGEKLLLDIEKDLEKINNSTSKFKDLMVEFCNMTRYEILILLGNNIIDLYNQAKDEDSQYALAKAYYNLSCEEYRKHSGYFPDVKVNKAALIYECLTANPAINKKVLKMKERHKKVD